MSQDDDFFVEDEPLEDAKAAFRRGEKGITKGPRDLNQRAKSIVDRAVERLEGTTVVDTAGWFAPAGSGASEPEIESTSVTIRGEPLAHA